MIHLRPEKERVTLSAAGRAHKARSRRMPANRARLDPAHGSGAGAPQDARRGHELAVPMDALQHRTVGDARSGERDVAAGKIGQFVFAVEIRNAEAGCARTFFVVAKDEARLDLASDAA